MTNDLLSKYAALAGQNRGHAQAQNYEAGRLAKREFKDEIARQRAERKAAEDEERRGWWKQLIPGALGLVGAGIGTAVGGPVGTYFGGALGGMLGSGISAKQGVPGAGAAFNQFSPMMMQAMAGLGAPDQFAGGGGYNGGDRGLESLQAEYGPGYGRARATHSLDNPFFGGGATGGAMGSPSKSFNPDLGLGLDGFGYDQDPFGQWRF